ncbi:MAG: hypothetical protein H7101_05565 [Deinococcales bacterium]|nr:hypothetical protein [Chitinophagaceae bacterium]
MDRFLQVPTDASADVKKIIANITKTEKATPFLALYAARYGFPVWKHLFGSNKQPANQQVQSSYTTLNNSSTNHTGVYFIPLTDSITGRTKAFIYCIQYNDTLFTYRTYDIDKALASQPTQIP